jgi:hypothetical protein
MVHDIIRAVIFNASFAVIARELFLSIFDRLSWFLGGGSAGRKQSSSGSIGDMLGI